MESKSPKPLVIFDLVSTLTDAGPRYARAFTEVCLNHGIEPPREKDILKALGNKNLKEIIDEFAPGLPEDAVAGFMGDCNETCDQMLSDDEWNEHLFENVKPTLEALHEQGYLLGIYTGTRDDALESQLAYHNIGDFFETRFIRAKNNERDGFIQTGELKGRQLVSIIGSYVEYLTDNRFDVSDNLIKQNVIVIGDSVSDLEAARAAGLNFLGFAPTMAKQHAFAANGITEIFGDYKTLPMLLEQRHAVSEAAVRPIPTAIRKP